MCTRLVWDVALSHRRVIALGDASQHPTRPPPSACAAATNKLLTLFQTKTRPQPPHGASPRQNRLSLLPARSSSSAASKYQLSSSITVPSPPIRILVISGVIISNGGPATRGVDDDLFPRDFAHRSRPSFTALQGLAGMYVRGSTRRMTMLLIACGPENELRTGSSGASSCRAIYLLIKD
ncbi:hypothetical protein C8Q74DRAFT_1363211 [Fomes fomentarius]|nr:hypothetical protein C8Q74DRAFT_1363211 [Fomes fomentarius]